MLFIKGSLQGYFLHQFCGAFKAIVVVERFALFVSMISIFYNFTEGSQRFVLVTENEALLLCRRLIFQVANKRPILNYR